MARSQMMRSASAGVGSEGHYRKPDTTKEEFQLTTEQMCNRGFFKMSSVQVDCQSNLDKKVVIDALLSQNVKRKARPKSACVTAAAWRAYGSPSLRGQMRPEQPPSPAHPRMLSKGPDPMATHVPTVGCLGGGFMYPASGTRQIASPQLVHHYNRPSTSTRGWSASRTKLLPYQATSGGVQLSEQDLVPDVPHLLQPKHGRVVELLSHASKGDGSTAVVGVAGLQQDGFRYAPTQPTHPEAHRIWKQMVNKAETVKHNSISSSQRMSTGSARPPSASKLKHQQPQATAVDAMTGSLRPGSARFSSMSVQKARQLGMYYQPLQVPGHVQPEQSHLLPGSNEAAVAASRLGPSTMSWLQSSLKLSMSAAVHAGSPVRPASPAQVLSVHPHQRRSASPPGGAGLRSPDRSHSSGLRGAAQRKIQTDDLYAAVSHSIHADEHGDGGYTNQAHVAMTQHAPYVQDLLESERQQFGATSGDAAYDPQSSHAHQDTIPAVSNVGSHDAHNAAKHSLNGGDDEAFPELQVPADMIMTMTMPDTVPDPSSQPCDPEINSVHDEGSNNQHDLPQVQPKSSHEIDDNVETMASAANSRNHSASSLRSGRNSSRSHSHGHSCHNIPDNTTNQYDAMHQQEPSEAFQDMGDATQHEHHDMAEFDRANSTTAQEEPQSQEHSPQHGHHHFHHHQYDQPGPQVSSVYESDGEHSDQDVCAVQEQEGHLTHNDQHLCYNAMNSDQSPQHALSEGGLMGGESVLATRSRPTSARPVSARHRPGGGGSTPPAFSRDNDKMYAIEEQSGEDDDVVLNE